MDERDIQQQVIINTQRLTGLELRVDHLETKIDLTPRIAVAEDQMIAIRAMLAEQRTLIYSIFAFAIVQLVAIVFAGIEYYIKAR